MTDQLDTFLFITRMLPDNQVHATHKGRPGREGDPELGQQSGKLRLAPQIREDPGAAQDSSHLALFEQVYDLIPVHRLANPGHKPMEAEESFQSERTGGIVISVFFPSGLIKSPPAATPSSKRYTRYHGWRYPSLLPKAWDHTYQPV